MMKALVKTAKGPGFIEIQERAIPKIPFEDWVLIKVKAAGVCGTDLHIWHDQYQYWPPVILGHEFSGEIVELGKKVEGWRIGDRVAAEPHSKACGKCELCRTGRIQLCKDKRSPGWGIDGAFAEYVTMPAFLLHHIPEGVNWEMAAIAEPMAIAIHQVLERCRVDFQDCVVVSGAGPIGILSAFLAKRAGAATVIATGITRSEEVRLPVAKKLGADYCINVEKTDLVKTVMDITGGRGADVVIEASGNPRAIATSFDLLRTGGRISAIGISGKSEIPIPWDKAIMNVYDIYFNMSSSFSSWLKAMSILGSCHDILTDYVTTVVEIENWKQTFERLEEELEIKALFKF